MENNYKQKKSQHEQIFGKLPPQNVQLEADILGALMLEKSAYNVVNDILQPDCFYTEAHQKIYTAIHNLVAKNYPIDMMTVCNELKNTGDLDMVGGPMAMMKLTNGVVSSANIEVHSRIVLEKYLLRELIRISGEVITKAYDETNDVFDILDFTEENVSGLRMNNVRKDFTSLQKVMQGNLQRIEELRLLDGSLTGVPSGFNDLDDITSGWQATDLIILAARPSVGKCLGLGTKVIMFDGSLKNVEDVVVGDLLMGDDSTARNVLSLARGTEMMYNVQQVRGMEYRINESHILSLMASRNQGLSKHGDVIDMPLTKYLSQTTKFQNNWKGYKVGFDFPAQDVIIPPYMLGIWLGDGSAAKPEICKPDAEIMHYLSGYADGAGLKMNVLTPENKCRSYTITSRTKTHKSENFIEKLKVLDVFKNKHIPREYLINSKENRLQLLAGLLDTDGYLQEGGGYEIIQKSERLINDIKFLCDSLGFRCSLTNKIGKIKSTGFEGMYFRLTIYGDIWNIPLKIKRKIWHKQSRYRDHRISGLTITKDKIDNYYGFVIDGNSRFLLEDGTVTHNTAFALTLTKNAAESFKNDYLNKRTKKQKAVGFFSLEMKDRSLVNRVLSADSEIWMGKLRDGKINDYQMKKLYMSAERLSKIEIFIDDTAALKIQEFKTKARIMVRKHNVGMIVIDYLQLMKDHTKKLREQEISSISAQLKEMAKELDIPIIALSQMSREFAKAGAGVREPQLSDLRESGAIEQDADIVMFLFKPSDAAIAEDTSLEEIFYTKIVKHRNGKAPVTFIGKFIGDIQKHEWLHNVDSKTLIPLNNSFKPVTTDYSAPQTQQMFDEEDVPVPF